MNINAQQAILNEYILKTIQVHMNLNCLSMYDLKPLLALIFIITLQFPPGISIATIL